MRDLRSATRLGLAVAAALMAGSPNAIAGEAMNLDRLDPRWVVVQVVMSARGDGEQRLSAPAFGWFEAGPDSSRRTVRVPGSEVERVFLSDRWPVAHSFSDFLWRFDAETGDVSASVSGLLDEPIRLGPLWLRGRVSIAMDLSTRVLGGYTRERRLAGRTVVDYCPDPARPGCTAVLASPYQVGSGWVRANGPACAVWRGLSVLAYTSLGHARFRELEPGSATVDPRLVSSSSERVSTSMRRPGSSQSLGAALDPGCREEILESRSNG